MTSRARSEGCFIRSGLVLVLSAALWIGCSKDALDPQNDGSGGGPASTGGAGGAPAGGAAGAGGASVPDGGCFAIEAPNEPAGPGSFLYESPGCGVATPTPVCKTAIPSCISLVCSCAGKVISGCHYYPAPYAYPLSLDAGAEGTDCDPNTPPGH